MTRADITELHYITHLDNVPSILEHGILAYNEVARLRIPHRSIAMAEIQARRNKQVPGGRRLHDYANLYFNARNAMMFRRTREPEVGNAVLVVLRVNPDVLEMPSAVIADRNASSDYVRFLPSPSGLELLDATMVFARDWRDDDPITYWQKKAAACAELLVPQRVAASYVTGIYVSCSGSLAVVRHLAASRPRLDIVTRPDTFFL